MPPTSLTDGKSIKMVVSAASGWGKTRLAGTSSGTALFVRPPVDYVDSILPEDKARHKQWVVTDWAAMEDCQEHLRHEGSKLYSWVWLDSISSFQDIGLDDLWDTIITEKPHRKRYGLDKGDYWINMQRMGRWIRNMVALSNAGKFNFGITATIADMQPSEDEERPRKLMPFIQGKNMAPKVCAYTNVVAFGDLTDKGNRILRLQSTDRYFAKDQFDMFPNYRLLNPTMPKIIAAADAARAKKKRNTKAATRPRTTTNKMRVKRGGK